MKLFYFLEFFIFITILFKSNCQTTNHADFICKTLLNNQPFTYDLYFDPLIVKNLPLSTFRSIIFEATNAAGPCTNYQQQIDGTFHFNSKSDDIIIIKFTTNNYSNLINSFVILDVILNSMNIRNFVDTMNYAYYFMNGTVSVTIDVRGVTNRVYQDTFQNPTASGFKLYVLGALINKVKNNILNWNDTIKINDTYKSLPSGILQNLPDGTSISVYDAASYMMNISDNTAADHLINLIGRDAVQKQLITMNNSFAFNNTPFMMTNEMFKLKWGVSQNELNNYLQKNLLDKRSYLDQILPQFNISLVVPLTSPYHIMDVEWFASSTDLCSAMYYILDQNSKEALTILGQNAPFVNSSVFDYAGFKGGSEPGVYTFTYLLRHKINGRWGCISYSHYDTKYPLNSWVSFSFIQKIFSYAETYFISSSFIKNINYYFIFGLIALIVM